MGSAISPLTSQNCEGVSVTLMPLPSREDGLREATKLEDGGAQRTEAWGPLLAESKEQFPASSPYCPFRLPWLVQPKAHISIQHSSTQWALGGLSLLDNIWGWEVS